MVTETQKTLDFNSTQKNVLYVERNIKEFKRILSDMYLEKEDVSTDMMIGELVKAKHMIQHIISKTHEITPKHFQAELDVCTPAQDS